RRVQEIPVFFFREPLDPESVLENKDIGLEPIDKFLHFGKEKEIVCVADIAFDELYVLWVSRSNLFSVSRLVRDNIVESLWLHAQSALNIARYIDNWP